MNCRYFKRKLRKNETISYLHFGELVDDLGEFVVERLLQELDFPCVERANPPDRVLSVHDGRSFPLGLGKDHFFQLLENKHFSKDPELVIRFFLLTTFITKNW